MKPEQIAVEIIDYIRKCGGVFAGWYVGITGDPRGRLFTEHGVLRDADAWIFRPASTASAARSVENYFLHRCGTDGGPGGGDESSTFVYAYRKNAHTSP